MAGTNNSTFMTPATVRSLIDTGASVRILGGSSMPVTDTTVPVIFSLNIPAIIGTENLAMLHAIQLPETLLLDIYMSWRSIFKRPPSSNDDFVHYYGYFQEQLEMVYTGFGLPEQQIDSIIAAHLDQLVQMSYAIATQAELEFGATLQSMPDHEFVFDSVREVPGGDGMAFTMTHDPRFITPNDEDPKELGPTNVFTVKFTEPTSRSLVELQRKWLELACCATDFPPLTSEQRQAETQGHLAGAVAILDQKERYGF